MSKLTSYDLKLIAFILMIIDHIGLLVGSPLCRFFGRISFPLFCLQFAQSCRLSSDRAALEKRLIIWGLIALPFHWQFLGGGIHRLNVMLFFAFLSYTLRHRFTWLAFCGSWFFSYNIFGLLLFTGGYYRSYFLIFLSIVYYGVCWSFSYAVVVAFAIVLYYCCYPFKRGHRGLWFYPAYCLQFVFLLC